MPRNGRSAATHTLCVSQVFHTRVTEGADGGVLGLQALADRRDGHTHRHGLRDLAEEVGRRVRHGTKVPANLQQWGKAVLSRQLRRMDKRTHMRAHNLSSAITRFSLGCSTVLHAFLYDFSYSSSVLAPSASAVLANFSTTPMHTAVGQRRKEAEKR